MASETVRLCDIKPNPFRDMEHYPVDPQRIAKLRESIRTTGFWDNVVGRKNKEGEIEQAYGHQRIHAAREELGEKAKVTIQIQDLSDSTMLQIMARENDEMWRNSAEVDQETARAAVLAFAAGRIVLEKPNPDATKSNIRNAPWFAHRKDITDVRSSETERPYTASTLGDFLGWNEVKTKRVLSALELQEIGAIAPESYKDLSVAQGTQVTAEGSKTLNLVRRAALVNGATPEKADQEAKKAAQKISKEIADRLKSEDISATSHVASEGMKLREKVLKKYAKKDDPPLPNIDKKMVDLARWIEGFFADKPTNKEYQALKEVIQYVEHAQPYAVRELGQALEWIEGKAAELREGLGYSSGSLKNRK